MLTIAVLVFGCVNIVVVAQLSYRSLTREQSRRISFLANLLAGRAQTLILHDDRVALHDLITESVALEPDLSYVLVAGPGRAVVADTFAGELPGWLQSAALTAEDRPAVVAFDRPDGVRLRDLAVPVLDGSLGVVRVGVEESRVQGEVASLLSVVAAMVAAFLVSGAVATAWVARRITSPLHAIIRAVEDFELDGRRVKLGVRTGDELEVVAAQVEAMTDRLQDLYREQRSRQRELARVERLAAIGTLTAGLAHELNNPLAGVKSAAQRLARSSGDGARIERYAAVIEDACQRMERVLRGMLDFSRPREPQLAPVAVFDCVRAALELAEARVRRSCVAVEIDRDLPPVLADPDLLIQVVLNLLLNAADAVGVCDGRAECDRPAISIGAEEVSGSVKLWVADDGPGIPVENRERIFDPFFSTKATGKGTGLGLTTSWTLVQEMGGSLSLDAGRAGGACFVVELPVVRPETVREASRG